MAKRLRLICFRGQRLIGTCFAPEHAAADVTKGMGDTHPGSSLFFEQVNDDDTRRIEVRLARHGEAIDVGHIVVEKGNVGEVLDALQATQRPVPSADAGDDAACS